MTRRLRSAVAAVAITSCLVSTGGCFGRFRLVNAVHDFNKGVNHKVAETLVMWGLILILVYPLAMLGDILIFNVIDFWGGANIATARHRLPDGSEVHVEHVGAETLRVRHVDAAGKAVAFEIVKVGDKAGYVREPNGRVVGMVEQLPDGRIVRSVP